MDAIESADRLILGIDFGTTYSGATPDRRDDIEIIRTWPGGNAFTYEKVPSEIAFGPSDSLSRHASLRQSKGTVPAGARPGDIPPNDIFFFAKLDASIKNGRLDIPMVHNHENRWGVQLKPDESRLRCLKLLLETEHQLPSYVSRDDLQRQLSVWQKDPLTAVANYLTELFNHAKMVLQKRYGEYFVRTTRIEAVLTVPAIWSDRAKDATLQAASEAGMDRNIRIISEPEAAAVYTLQSIQPNHLQVGDNFIVCDAGGGTVDLISYEIKQTSPLRIEETFEIGECCGAAFLNIKFEEYVRSKLGDDQFRTLCLNQPRGWRAALKYFEEHVKRNYDPEDDMEFFIPFPGAPDNEAAGIYQGFLNLSSETIGQLLRPILQKITDLVEQQMLRLQELRKAVNSIVLVGGFGQSICLYKHLLESFSGVGPPPPYPGSPGSTTEGSGRGVNRRLEIMQPKNGWTAVARGAVLRGLEGAEIVLSRISRRHYGVLHTAQYDERRDMKSEGYRDDVEEQWRVTNLMRWYIGKGQTCSSSEPTLFPFYHVFEFDEGRNAYCTLVYCDEDVAPAKFDSSVNSPTKKACKLVVDLDRVPKQCWEMKTNSKGQKLKRLTFMLGM